MPEELHPTNEVLEVLDSTWMQFKVLCEKIKEQGTATESYISKIFDRVFKIFKKRKLLRKNPDCYLST